jgi:hypothetical protein
MTTLFLRALLSYREDVTCRTLHHRVKTETKIRSIMVTELDVKALKWFADMI